MSLQNPKFPSKLKSTEMADETELFYTPVSKVVLFATLLVSVSDLHKGLSSFVFPVKQITQNPLMATSCGFDPRHRHHTEIPNFLEIRGSGFFILSVSINKSGAEKFLENKIHECEKGAVGMICPLILDTQYWGYIRMKNRTARFSGFRGMNLKWSIEIQLYLIALKLYKKCI